MATNYCYPRLFVQRVALYKSFSLGDRIREIEFKRGLNLIIGEDAQEGLHNLGGHSVGKTTLCRLIRHCLGESTFASEEDQQAIRDNFPTGWVGCEVEIDGTPWAVLIPFTRTSKDVPLAAQHETLVSLFDLEKSDNQYRQYLGALDTLLPPQAAFSWVQHLAWLTRDQESIQGNYWEWRSASSQSGTALPKSHDSRALLVRSVMGLKADEEDVLLQDVKRIEQDISIHENQKKLQEQDLQNRVHHALEVLRQHVSFALSEPQKNAQLPSLFMVAFFQELEGEIQKAEIKHRAARTALLHSQIKESRIIDEIEKIQSVLSHKKQAVMFRSPNTGKQEYSAEKEFLEDIKEPKSCMGGILVTDCARVQALKDTYEKILDERQGKVLQFKTPSDKKIFDDNRKLIERLELDYDKNAKSLETTQKEREGLTTEENTLYSAYTALCRKCENLKEHWSILEQAWNVLCGGMPDESVFAIDHALKELNEAKADREFLISRLRSDLGEKIEKLQQAFDAIVKNGIDDNCQGTITPDGDKLNFAIKSFEKPLSKGAINISSIISGDIACMLSAADAGNYHPGFIIHDSPRNYELNPEKYFKILKYIAAIASQSHEEDIPFQYIASITSNASQEWKKFVRIQLASAPTEKLLFKNRLLPRQQSFI